MQRFFCNLDFNVDLSTMTLLRFVCYQYLHLEIIKYIKTKIGFIVKQVDVPVIPAFIGGAERFLPRHSFLPQPAKITVSFGQPLDFSHFANEPRRQQYKLIGQEAMAAIGDLRFQQGYD